MVGVKVKVPQLYRAQGHCVRPASMLSIHMPTANMEALGSSSPVPMVIWIHTSNLRTRKKKKKKQHTFSIKVNVGIKEKEKQQVRSVGGRAQTTWPGRWSPRLTPATMYCTSSLSHWCTKDKLEKSAVWSQAWWYVSGSSSPKFLGGWGRSSRPARAKLEMLSRQTLKF